ncbi:sulfurtransferase [Kaarinaea lacus]
MNPVKHVIATLILTTFNNLAMAVTLPGPLVTTAWLTNNLDDVVILDVRSDIMSYSDNPRFIKDKNTDKQILVKVGGHIPGALLVDYAKLRSKKIIRNRTISHMLPDKDTFEKLMQSTGVNKNDTLIIMSKGDSNGDMLGATRLYWSLKYFGHDNMAILDGGMTQWLKDGGKVASRLNHPRKGNWVATAERNEILATSEDVKNAINNQGVQLIDTRNISQYLGTYKKSYVYATGHIPGAINLPSEVLTGPSGNTTFTPADEIRELSKILKINPQEQMITYCNSGHLATGSWFVFSEILGNKNVKMYDGSMHQWTSENGETVSISKK